MTYFSIYITFPKFLVLCKQYNKSLISPFRSEILTAKGSYYASRMQKASTQMNVSEKKKQITDANEHILQRGAEKSDYRINLFVEEESIHRT